MRTPVMLVLIASAAHAQPAGEVREDTDAADPADTLTSAADTSLHLDAALRVTVDNLGSRIEHVDRQLALGRTRIVLQTEWREVDHDHQVRGWRTAVSGSYRIAGLDVIGSVGVEEVQTDLGRGSLRTVAIGVGKRFRLSRTVHGWFGVAAAARQWSGEPPPGEASTRQILVTGKLSY